MKESLREDIYKTYPEMFTGSKEISCGDGWYYLIMTACHVISAVCDKYPPPVFVQIKQKFGRLVMYIDFDKTTSGEIFKNVYSVIDSVANDSCKICEECGSDDDVRVRPSGWLTPLCRTCRSKNVKDNIYDLFVYNLIASKEITDADRITTRTKRHAKAIIDAIVDELEEDIL